MSSGSHSIANHPVNISPGVMALNLDKTAFTTFLHTMFSTIQHLELTTVSVSGTKEFTA
jgi:hypothetical protein